MNLLARAKLLFWSAIGAGLLACALAVWSISMREWPFFTINLGAAFACVGIAWVNLRAWRSLEAPAPT